MSLGQNIQYIRRQQKMTQEKLAERMSVSRQTISKWESDEVVPEVGKLVELCNLFSYKLDDLVRENLSMEENIYSEVAVKTVKGFRMARYVMITPNPENDVIAYMERWAEQAGLLHYDKKAKRIGWDFPFVSTEQQNRFGLRGYGAGYILPDGFKTDCPGVEFGEQGDAKYAVITVQDPFQAAFRRIPNAYRKIMEYLQANGFKENQKHNVLPCFEYVYERDGVICMDVSIHADSVIKANVNNAFS